MTAIGGTPYDTELFSDRVDVVRMGPGRNSSGQSKPIETVIAAAVPCKIVYGMGKSDVTDVSNLAVDQAQVIFAQHVALERDDILAPVSPTIGSRLRVGSYRFDSTIHYYWALCSQTS